MIAISISWTATRKETRCAPRQRPSPSASSPLDAGEKGGEISERLQSTPAWPATRDTRETMRERGAAGAVRECHNITTTITTHQKTRGGCRCCCRWRKGQSVVNKLNWANRIRNPSTTAAGSLQDNAAALSHRYILIGNLPISGYCVFPIMLAPTGRRYPTRQVPWLRPDS